MQSMMQNFYKKSKKSGKKGKSGRAREPKKKRGLTLSEMYDTVQQEPSSRSSGTNGELAQSSPFYTQNLSRAYKRNRSPADDRKVTFDLPRTSNFRKKPKVFTDNDVVDDILGGRRRGNSLKTELLMMKSDLQDYKQEAGDYEDLNRFEHILRETNPNREEEEQEEEGYGDAMYLTEDSERDYESMNMSQQIKHMSKEERDEYLEYKRAKKKEKWEREQRKIASFKPKINHRSKKIDQNRTKGRKVDRGQMLFGLKKVLKYREQQLKEIVETEKFMRYGRKEMLNCTFRPKINRKTTYNVKRPSIQERAQAFNQRKKQREQQRKREREQEEVAGCTFRPKINRRLRKNNGD